MIAVEKVTRDLAHVEKLMQRELLAGNLPRLPERQNLRERKRLPDPDVTFVRLPSTGPSSLRNDFQVFFMSPSSRMVERILLRCLSLFLMLGFVATESANGSESRTFSSNAALLTRPPEPALRFGRSSIPEHTSNANLKIVESWVRLKSPSLLSAGGSIAGSIKAVTDECLRQQSLQQNWLEENLTGVIDVCSRKSKRLVSNVDALNWVLDPFAFEHSDGSLNSLSQEVCSSPQAQGSYWSYYQDCERWDVDLTRTIQRRQPEVAAAIRGRQVAELKIADRSWEAVESGIDRSVIVVRQASGWLQRALRQIEFAAIESLISSAIKDVAQSD